MAAYDIAEAFAVIEDYLIDSLRRNMMRHIGEERREGINWSQWQAEMLYGLHDFKRVNTKMFDRIYPAISEKIEAAIWEAYDTGEAAQEQTILSAIRLGFKPNRPKDAAVAEFFRLNRRKMNALVTETKRSMQKAQYAALRMTEDQYRSIIFGAQVFYNAGAGTLWQAVDMASKKFLASGINCIEYKNGARVNIASYAEMALRTANTRAYLHGEAAKREQYGIHTVIVNRHNAACPFCVPFQGRVFIDDVWGSGTEAEAKVQGYPLLSEAIAGGLYHPNCKDSHTTFFAGINRFRPPTERMKEEQVRRYRLQQEQRYNERQIRKYKRLYRGTVDEKQRVKYARKLHEWQDRTRQLIDANPKILRRSPPREQLRDIPEELGITPPRQPPGIEIQARQPPPKKPDHQIQIVIDTTATDTPPKARALPDTAAAERQRDIEKIRAKTRLVTQKAKEMAQEAQAARQLAEAAQTKAQAATQKAQVTREQVRAIRTRTQLRDKRISTQMLDAKLAVAEAKKLRSIAEIKKTEARAAMRRCSTLTRMANGGRLTVSVEAKTSHPTAVKVKPASEARPVATVSVQSKRPVAVSFADAQRRKDIERIQAQVRLVKQKAAEMEKDAQTARQTAQAAEAKVQKAAQKAESSKQTVHSIEAKAKLLNQQVSKQMLDAKISVAQAKALRQSAEIAKTEARAAQRRYLMIIKSDEESRITASAESGSDSVSVTIQTSQERKKMLRKIAEQPWMQQVKQEHREDFARMFAGMDDKRLHFWEKYGKLIKGDLYYPTKNGFHRQDQVFLNLAESDIRSKILGYDCNIRTLLHESGHLLDYHLRITDNLPYLQEYLRDEFLQYVDNLLGTNIRQDRRLLIDSRYGEFHLVNHYYTFTQKQNDQIKNAIYGNGEIIHLRNGVSDIMEGLTEGELEMPYGHHKTPDYWVTHSVSTEAIAHLFEAYMNGGQKYQEFIRYFPKTMQYFEEYMNQLM